ncbi:MAG: hypothetical protein AAF696_04680 [Bacteroidota bacterium]
MIPRFYQKYKAEIHWSILAVVCALEFGLISWWRPGKEADANLIQSSLLFLSGMGVGIWAVRRSFLASRNTIKGRQKFIPLSMLWFIFPVLSLIILLPLLFPLFEKYAVSPQHSDIIPQIEVMARRFLNGEFPYAPIHDFGYELRSPYMPFHWGPFIVPESLGFDERWWVLSLWLVVYGIFTYFCIRRVKSIFPRFILIVLPGLFVYSLLRTNFVIFTHTVEVLILAYYVLLLIALFSENIWFIGTALICCLLSRYSLLFWAPLPFFILLVQKDYRKLGKLLALVVGGILLLYVIPFLSKDWTMPIQGLEHHAIVSLKNWTFEPWFGPNGKPGALYRGTGLAAFFFEYWPGDAKTQMSVVQNIQLFASALLLALFSLIYYRNHQRIQNTFYLMGSLKVMLVFFYSFLALPIDYYFIVPVFISLGILLYQGSQIKKEKTSFPQDQVLS